MRTKKTVRKKKKTRSTSATSKRKKSKSLSISVEKLLVTSFKSFKKWSAAQASWIWIAPAFVFLLASTFWVRNFVPSSIPKNPTSKIPTTLVRHFETAKNLELGERISYWSENLYKNPSLLYPLGDGPQTKDTAPLFPKGYDCTTFVETVGALSRSSTGGDLADRLIEIRYKNAYPSYVTRNHFPEADWIPNNVKAGTLKDITKEISKKAGVQLQYAEKAIYKLEWLQAQRNVEAKRAIASELVPARATDVEIPYIPLTQVMPSVQAIPQGAVLNIVRENKERYPVLISHQGFVIWKKGVPYFRHASRNKEIRETLLSQYLKEASHMPWKVIGVNFNAFQKL
jgi:hypothetical protein